MKNKYDAARIAEELALTDAYDSGLDDVDHDDEGDDDDTPITPEMVARELRALENY